MFKSLVKQAIPYLPLAMRQSIRDYAEKVRRSEHQARKQRGVVSTDELISKIASLGVDRDVMVHASVSNIGKLDRPIPQLVDALLAQIDLSRQTILSPALSYNSTMVEYVATTQSFDVRTAKNAMGAISQNLGRREGAIRSLHPTHSVIALGANSLDYVTGHERDATPFGPNSAYAKLARRRGQILAIGVGMNSITSFHVNEDLVGAAFPVKVYLPETTAFRVTRYDGSHTGCLVPCHDPHASARRDGERARPWLEAAGAIRTLSIGESEISVIDAFLLTKVMLEKLLEGQSAYGRFKLSRDQKVAVENALAEFEAQE